MGPGTPRKAVEPLSVPERLDLVVMPAERCNFRCSYCFQQVEPATMSPATVRGLERWIAARAPSLQTLMLSWYGGEPLLAADVVERVQRHAWTLAADAGFELGGSMTTNGYLLRPGLLRRLVDHGLGLYQISLDGTREHHDRTRVLAGGQGTFERIWHNLRRAKELDRRFRIVIRVHVGRHNREDVRGLLDRMGEAFGGDGRFVAYVRALFRYGGRSDTCDDVLDAEEAQDAVASLHARAERLGLTVRAGEGGGGSCHAPLPYRFVVRADGTLGKCPVALSHVSNAIGRLHEDGRVSLDIDRVKPWLRGLASMDPGELACPARGLAF